MDITLIYEESSKCSEYEFKTPTIIELIEENLRRHHGLCLIWLFRSMNIHSGPYSTTLNCISVGTLVAVWNMVLILIHYYQSNRWEPPSDRARKPPTALRRSGQSWSIRLSTHSRRIPEFSTLASSTNYPSLATFSPTWTSDRLGSSHLSLHTCLTLNLSIPILVSTCNSKCRLDMKQFPSDLANTWLQSPPAERLHRE
jgi:hypothetical protein